MQNYELILTSDMFHFDVYHCQSNLSTRFLALRFCHISLPFMHLVTRLLSISLFIHSGI